MRFLHSLLTQGKQAAKKAKGRGGGGEPMHAYDKVDMHNARYVLAILDF